MSSDGFARFMRAVNDDADLAEDLVRASAEKGGEPDAQVLAEFARTRGYDVSREDIEKHRSADQDGELSEEALDALAGGKPVWVLNWNKNNPQ